MLQDEAWRLVAAVAAVLIVASVIGQVLKYTLARNGAHAAIDNLNHRINAWWAIAILVGLALLAGRAGVTLLFALASLAALREFVPREAAAGTPAWVLRGSFALVLPLQYLLVWNGNPLLYSLFIPACVLLVLPLLGLLSGRPDTFMSHTRSLRAGLLICVFAVSHVPALLTLHLPGPAYSNAYLLVFLLLVVQSSDVFQYLWGKLTGRHLIAPRLSPSKTVEGTVGGILSASALGAGLASLTPFTPREAMLIALADHAARLPRRPGHVGDQAPPRHQGLGNADSRPRRHARPARLTLPLGSGLLLPAALGLGHLSRHGQLHTANDAATVCRAGHPTADRQIQRRRQRTRWLPWLRQSASW
jgi:phosphatidate cytidylyltransferase